jgi:CO/xanthine dehydrogenase Mo-binding subunit
MHGVYTNSVFTGAFRGFGSPQMNFVVEQMVERAAEKAGISEIEFRRRNMVRQGDRTITGQVLEGHVVSLEQVLEKALLESGYEEKRRRSTFGKPVSGELYGIGLALSYRGMSLGAEGKDFCNAIVNVQFDGSVLLEVAVHENGQGSESAMIELLSQELGIARERIRYRRGSTSAIPDGGTTVASRATLMGGGAVCRAAKELKKVFRDNLADHFGCAPELIEIADDRVRGPQGPGLGFEEAVRLLFLEQSYPYAFGVFQAPQVSWDEETGQGKAYFTWVYGCQVAELKVDAASGKVTLLNSYAVHDVGRVVNPGMLLGQCFGGMVMGMGYALLEEVVEKDGVIVHLNLDRNLLMRSRDVPEMNAFFVENHDPQSPSGAKGIGEPAMELMAPAIANALYAATGKRFNHLPLAGQVRQWAKNGGAQ